PQGGRVRGYHPDVDLSGRVRGGGPRGHRSGDGRRHAAAGVVRAGKRHLARFALDVGAFTLEFFEGYYGLPYPGDKLDMLAIPDFAAGAMENLGAITYRETALLVDEAVASHTERERVADVVAHEIAHMWFGD